MAYYLVIEREVEGLDASDCGKALDQAEDLGHVADCAGAQPLAAYFSEDWAAPAVCSGVFGAAGIEHPDDGFPATRWFPAEEGLAWVRSMLSYLVAHPTIVSDGIALIGELGVFESVFIRLASEGIRWHLGIADPDEERIERELEAKLNRLQPEELDKLLHGDLWEAGGDWLT